MTPNSRRRLPVLLLAVLLTAPAAAAGDVMTGGRASGPNKAAAERPAVSGVDRPAGFALQSEVVALDPDVAASLRLAAAAPNDPSAWRALGTALAEKGSYVDAIEAFGRATEIDRDDADAWADLGAAQLRSGRAQAAASTLRRAIRIEPFHGLAHYNLGLAYDAMNRYDDALREFELAVTIDPKLGDPAHNPSAATNRHIDMVKLRVYMRTVGASAAGFTLPASD